MTDSIFPYSPIPHLFTTFFPGYSIWTLSSLATRPDQDPSVTQDETGGTNGRVESPQVEVEAEGDDRFCPPGLPRHT